MELFSKSEGGQAMVEYTLLFAVLILILLLLFGAGIAEEINRIFTEIIAMVEAVL
jgi:Flp pilus assembly pilin Flp